MRVDLAKTSSSSPVSGPDATAGHRHHRRLMALTDLMISHLEELNLRDHGSKIPDQMTAGMIAETLRKLPEDARGAYLGQRTVQQALDAFFLIQGILLTENRCRSSREPGDGKT